MTYQSSGAESAENSEGVPQTGLYMGDVMDLECEVLFLVGLLAAQFFGVLQHGEVSTRLPSLACFACFASFACLLAC